MANARELAKRFVAQNRRARFDYEMLDTLEAGLVLTGTEVKSLRGGRASLNEAHAGERDGQIWLYNLNIPPYESAGRHLNHEPTRPRILLLHKRQRDKWLGALRRDGLTIVPISIYFDERGRAKAEIGLGRGKRKEDKRETIKQRDWQRDKARIMRARG